MLLLLLYAVFLKRNRNGVMFEGIECLFRIEKCHINFDIQCPFLIFLTLREDGQLLEAFPVCCVL